MGFLGKGLFEGMAVTARNFVGTYFDRGTREKLVTYQYPEEKPPLPENSRSFPFLVFDGTADKMRCVACKICETECPPQCIYIVMDRDEKGKPQQRPKVFDIDISVCMQCQICVEVCPFEAIKMDNDYEKSRYGRFDDLVEHLPDLLKSNEYYNQIKPTEAKAVDAKLKTEAEKKAKKAAPKPAAPAPVPSASPVPKPVTKITIPEDAPFNSEQRAWLAGFLSSISAGGVAPAVPSGTPSAAAAQPAAETAAATPETPAGNWPWHDPGLGLSQRMDLVQTAPLADKLMAAMAQTDCHACGYDCRGYADAIAAGSESDLSLCLPGESETAKKLEELMKAAGKL
jgi:NADH-quinone oxidoreductase subunit I